MTRNRWILLVLLVAAIAAVAKKAKSHEPSDWHGLTEREARAKLDAKLPEKIPAEKRAAISDKVVAKMRDRGVLSEEPTGADDAATDEAAQLADH